MKKKLLVFCMSLVVFIGIIWFSKTTTGSDTVIIKNISSNQIQVEDYIGDTKTKNITIPQIIKELLIVDNEYEIEYKKNRWSKNLKLIEIEPITSNDN